MVVVVEEVEAAVSHRYVSKCQTLTLTFSGGGGGSGDDGGHDDPPHDWPHDEPHDDNNSGGKYSIQCPSMPHHHVQNSDINPGGGGGDYGQVEGSAATTTIGTYIWGGLALIVALL